MTDRYPLAWPEGWPRTAPGRRQGSRFEVSFARACTHLDRQLETMRARSPVLSTNVELRLDGRPRAGAREPEDPGAALYFYWRGQQLVLACDRWRRVRDNVRAIGLTLEALRGIERWGASELMHRAFAGFRALPPPGEPARGNGAWWQVLGVSPEAPLDVAEAAYRALMRKAHPDTGGSAEEAQRLNEAIKAARAAARGTP